ncbi:TlpA family protein disulfide reductase [Amycolatopsis silviterrae]|uniref:TlpA family protein disulfide reductase n=1 Tax=Amycolatopsis silviterrae TaxID=1656914 RepID=A0ABW5HGX5_9PSEU
MSRRHWRIAVPVSALLVAVLTVLAVAALRPSEDVEPVKRPAPDFALQKLDGSGPLRLADLRGHPAVLNFWASWCAPCKAEFAVLRGAWPRYRQRGFVFVAIVFDDTTAAAGEFLRTAGADWPVVVDEKSRAALSFGVRGIPQTYFLDGDGRIDHVERGPLTPSTLAARLSSLEHG